MEKINSKKSIIIDNVKVLIKALFMVILFGIFPAVMCFWAIISNNTGGYLIVAIIIMIFGIGITYMYTKQIVSIIKYIINPESDLVFRKYGSFDKIDKIIEQMYQDNKYEDNRIIISNKFIYIKKHVYSLCALEDIVGVYKFIVKRNGQVTSEGISYHDKYGSEYRTNYSYLLDTVDLDKIIKILIPRCKNAKFGYTDGTRKYIYSQKSEIPKQYDGRNIKEADVDYEIDDETYNHDKL